MSKPNEATLVLRKEKLHAKAVATVLHEEFGVPFTIYDPIAGITLWPQPFDDGPGAIIAPADLEELRQIASSDRVRLSVLPRGGYRLRLPLGQSGGPILIAEAVLKALAVAGPDVAEEQSRIQRWAQSVLERLRQSDLVRSRRHVEDDLRAQLKNAWGLNLTLERLIRHLRVHKDEPANRQQILEAAFPFVGVQAILWVPQRHGPALVEGEPALAVEDARLLTGMLRKERELHESGLLLCNQPQGTPWGARFPALRNLMVFATPAGAPVGWLIAINKRGPERPLQAPENHGAAFGFHRADAASLAPFAALLGLQVRACERYQDLKDLLVGLTRSLTSAVDAKDPYTYGHSERVARIAVELGRELQLNEDELSDLYLAGLLHDVGKIGIRDDVLCKHAALTPEELEHMKQHPSIGHAILKDLRQIRSLLPGVLYHHERFDGKGYPVGLAGEQIPLLARILAVADSYDAMNTTRPYRNGLPLARVEEILAEGANGQWDPRVIEAFQRCRDRLRLIRERGLGESLRHALDGALRDHGSTDAPQAPAAELLAV